MADKELIRFSKGPHSEIVVRLLDDDGFGRGLDIREFVHYEKYTGFTKKGVRVPEDMIADFVAALTPAPEYPPATRTSPRTGEIVKE